LSFRHCEERVPERRGNLLDPSHSHTRDCRASLTMMPGSPQGEPSAAKTALHQGAGGARKVGRASSRAVGKRGSASKVRSVGRASSRAVGGNGVCVKGPAREDARPTNGRTHRGEDQGQSRFSVGPDVRIWLHQGSACQWIVKKTANDGAYNLIVPDVPAASNYKIRVQSYDDPTIRAFSHRFSISAGP